MFNLFMGLLTIIVTVGGIFGIAYLGVLVNRIMYPYEVEEKPTETVEKPLPAPVEVDISAMINLLPAIITVLGYLNTVIKFVVKFSIRWLARSELFLIAIYERNHKSSVK
jgi:hypothetical protein